MDNKYLKNKQFLAYFRHTALAAFENSKNAFDLPDKEFDKQTENWLISITDCIREDIVRALLTAMECEVDLLSEESIRAMRFLPEVRDIFKKTKLDSQGESLLLIGIYDKFERNSLSVDPRYIGECIYLLEELDQVEEYIDSKNYKKLANFIIFPLLRHARMGEYWANESSKIENTSEEEVIALRNAKIATKRYSKKQLEKVEALALAEMLWKSDKNDYEDFRHDQMTKYLVNEASSKDGSLLFPQISEVYIRRDIADLARKLGKRVHGEKL